MALKMPPSINGLMELTPEEKAAITDKLVAIRTAFVPTDDQPVCDTFYVTATYNQQNADTPINGDTVQMLLGEYDNPPQGV